MSDQGCFGRARSIRVRSHAMPCASIFAHCAAVSRIERCSSFVSGEAGGLPLDRFGSSMRQLSVIHKTLANYHLLNHNICMTNAQANALIASAYNLHFGKQANKVMTPAEAAKLPRGDRAALCRVLEEKGGSDLYTAVDARAAFARVVG